MIVDAKPPDRQPNERQNSFQYDHLLPAICSQQPTSERSGGGHGQGLTQIPIRISARSFVSWKPICEKYQGCREHPTFRNSQQKPSNFKLCERFCQPARHRANPPCNEEIADNLPCAPA